MRLAVNKNGQIGRLIPSTGMDAQVAVAGPGDHRGSVHLSARSIAADQAFYAQQEQEEQAYIQAQRQAAIAKRNEDFERQRRRNAQVQAFQRVAQTNPMMGKLRAHFARRAGMGESEIVADSLLRNPADFSSSGANPEIVPGQRMTGGDEWRADFRQHLIVGNPLTRDGEYGPAVTDWDRYLQGTDVNQIDVVQLNSGGVPEKILSYYSETMDDELPIAGGTILGRYDGQVAPAGTGNQAMSGHPRAYPAGERRGIPRGLPGRFNSDQGMGRGMGWDFSWDGLTNALSDVGSQTADNLVDSLPDQLAKEIQQSILGGGKVVSQGGGVVTIQRPATGAVNTISQTIGLPSWAIYSALGLVGIGTLFMLIKAVKK